MKKKIPTLDDILGEAETIVQKLRPVGKVELWLEQNPEKAELFWQAIDSTKSGRSNVSSIIKACQHQLGGPPGAHSTVRVVINERERSQS